MTNEEKTTEEISEVKKTEQSDPSALSIIASLVKKQDERIDSFEKRFDSIESLIKEHNSNPVDSGVEAENKPKTEDADDVGDKVTIGNEVAPKPSDSQASIIAPALESNTADVEGLKMENKSEVKKDDDEKKDEKKEEKTDSVEKMDEEKKDDKKDEEIKKSSDNTYEIVKTVRPKVYQPEARSNIPTAYQMLKATINGFGETQSAEQALILMHQKYENGDFGEGQPTFEGVY